MVGFLDHTNGSKKERAMKHTIKTKTILLCTVTMCLGSYAAYGQSVTSGPRYTPRAEISEQNYTQTEHTEDRMDNKSYGEYEQREPCQNYRKPPRNYTGNCGYDDYDVVELTPVTLTRPAQKRDLLPIVSSYTVLFDFDKSNVRPNENETLSQILREIDKYDPEQITVTGYTDSSGAIAYNQTLSREREQAVSKALMQRGIENQTIDREARGEYDQAVKTPDDTRNQENRRVVIDFRR
jgi:OmpA-OmpF porin, OOP family